MSYGTRHEWLLVCGSCLISGVLIVGALVFSVRDARAAFEATTTVSLTVCGDALVSGSEFCDDGTNTGAYATSIASRNCNPLCRAYGPYCGDGIIQTFYGEECDDSNNTAGDLCDALCQNESDPVIVGGGGGGGSGGGGGGAGSGNNAIPGASVDGEIPFNGTTEVIIEGRAYPGATVTILQDGDVVRIVEAGSDASFEHRLSDLTAGATTFGFSATDRAGRRSITYASTFQVIENAVTTLSGILLPPTLVVVPETIPPGTPAAFEGSALPGARVTADINNRASTTETIAAGDGTYRMTFPTSGLTAEQFHRVKANFRDPARPDLVSGFSQVVSFYVGVNTPAEGAGTNGDLNGDSIVNLTDFSILLFNWNTSNAIADLNKDGTVSLPDFSIMLFYWTG